MLRLWQCECMSCVCERSVWQWLMMTDGPMTDDWWHEVMFKYVSWLLYKYIYRWINVTQFHFITFHFSHNYFNSFLHLRYLGAATHLFFFLLFFSFLNSCQQWGRNFYFAVRYSTWCLISLYFAFAFVSVYVCFA